MLKIKKSKQTEKTEDMKTRFWLFYTTYLQKTEKYSTGVFS